MVEQDTNLPPLPEGAPRRPRKAAYREQYGVILVCKDEPTQRVLFEALEQVRTCKIKVVVT